MATDITNAIQSCPNSKVVTSGYSQGAQLVHNSAKELSVNTASKISSAVVFGDPDNGDAVAGVSADRTLVICHTGDDICAHGSQITSQHLNYVGADTDRAAQFIISHL
ncbi:hypothetical protein VKT23_019143 [Stygiomarasmius scandens]|uniref:Cutinase n=1 Tax=Marasmiellus scandens TaxID=2682957 RepID=A0ABR1IMC2_9AGAR